MLQIDYMFAALFQQFLIPVDLAAIDMVYYN